MYEEYPIEVQDQIRELELEGKTLKEIIIASINACTEIICDPEGNSQCRVSKFKKNVQELQGNQIKWMYRLDDINK